jgi:hypothetical protein
MFTDEERAEGLTVKCEVCQKPKGEECVSAINAEWPCTFGMHSGRIERRPKKKAA